MTELETDPPSKRRGRVLVLGGRGMLGRHIATAARAAGYQAWAPDSIADITNLPGLRTLDNELAPHYVVNCAGVIPVRQGMRSSARMVEVNAFGPWNVVEAFPNSKVVHISTDCVFSGAKKGAYSVDDTPDATDLYGRSKAMGEPIGAVVIRCSFIGVEHGLLHWLLSQPSGARVPGYSLVAWNGSTVMDVAQSIVERMLDQRPGIYHMAATTPTTKYQLIKDLIARYELDLRVIPCAEPVRNRTLLPTHFIERRLELLPSKATVGAS